MAKLFSPLHGLPRDLCRCILSLVGNAKDLLNLSIANKSLHSLVMEDDWLWQQLCIPYVEVQLLSRTLQFGMQEILHQQKLSLKQQVKQKRKQMRMQKQQLDALNNNNNNNNNTTIILPERTWRQ